MSGIDHKVEDHLADVPGVNLDIRQNGQIGFDPGDILIFVAADDKGIADNGVDINLTLLIRVIGVGKTFKS